MIVSLAGRTLQIDAASDFALAAVAPAFTHLAPAGPDVGATRWALVEEDDSWRPDAFGATGTYRFKGGGFAVVQSDPPAMESYRPATGIELRAGRAGLMAGDSRSHPASFALASWLSGPRAQVLHAGAIAYGGAAALFIGSSGVGKSTTALACAMAGADFLGDDLVLVETADRPLEAPVVHALFATAKLNDDSATALDARGWPTLGVTPKNKAVIAVGGRMKVARSAPIVALIVLAPPASGRSAPEPLRPGEALALLMPTATPVASRTGRPAELLAVVAGLARSVPAWRLPVTWALETLEAAVRRVVERAAGGEDRMTVRRGEGRP